MAKRVLILFAHPALQKSRVNRRLIAAVSNLENVTINDLYEEYPDFCVNVKREQDLLRSHDIIIFQHPFYWYSCPALLKEWEDLVLEYGFAYGGDRDETQREMGLDGHHHRRPSFGLPTKRLQLFYDQGTVNALSNRPFGFAEWSICRPLSSAEPLP